MSTVGSLVSEAMKLLQYGDRFGAPDSEQYAAQYRTAIAYVNLIVSDISRIEHVDFVPLTSLDDVLPISDTSVYDIAPYGVAMWLAQSNNDGDNQAYFAALYNQKRNTAPRTKYTITQTYTAKQETTEEE